MSSWRSSWSRTTSLTPSSAAAASGVLDHVAQLVDETLGLPLLEEGHAAEDDLGLGDLLAVVGRDGRDDDEDAVGRERAPVAQGNVVGIADVDAVDEDHRRP